MQKKKREFKIVRYLFVFLCVFFMINGFKVLCNLSDEDVKTLRVAAGVVFAGGIFLGLVIKLKDAREYAEEQKRQERAAKARVNRPQKTFQSAGHTDDYEMSYDYTDDYDAAMKQSYEDMLLELESCQEIDWEIECQQRQDEYYEARDNYYNGDNYFSY